MKPFNCKMFMAVAVVLTMAMGATATDKPAASPALGVLGTVTSAELPAKAAELVAQADAKTLKQTTIEVVKAAVGLNPAAAPAIVGSIAQASPAMAATATATAVALVPDQVLLIARAAAAAAPAKAGAIVEAICRVLPADYKIVAEAVAEVVPGAGREILAGIATAMPQLKDTINEALASYQGKIPSVSTVLTQVAQSQNTTAIAAISSGNPIISSVGGSPSVGGTTVPAPARGPSQGPPFVPVSGTPTVTTPSSGGVTPNPVNYSPP
jgi:hypothetical protein